MLTPATATPAATLETQLREIAALPGEPHAVGAAAVTRSETPLLTIENRAAFDAGGSRRVVLIGAADDERATSAALAAVRWFKTSAPQAVRQRWQMSALPASDPDKQRVRRWVVFQAPDLVVDINAGGTISDSLASLLAADDAGLGPVRVVTTAAAAGLETIQRALTSRDVARSPLHAAVVKRVERDPLAIARRLARRYPQTPAISYIPAVAWVNTLRLGDEALRAKVREQTRPWIAGEKKLFGDQIPLTAVAGTMIFAELAVAGGDAGAARELAIEGANKAALEKADGIPQYGQGWTDDMFMAAAILARTGSLSGRATDLDRAARLLIDYAARLQRADGIFIHAGNAPVTWGRGNGFAALGLMETLTALPATHPARANVLAIYRRLIVGLGAMQAPDGMWRQVIDEPGSYREFTATAMILAATARGIRLGWLDRGSLPLVERAWRALAAHVADDGALVDVCAGTGAGPTKQYYLDRPAITGADDRGGAMALLASVEMHELTEWAGKAGRAGKARRRASLRRAGNSSTAPIAR
jgi:unsaturated rhamnogalacturonyl hydrolase